MRDVIVIGAGAAGLAAARELRRAGHSVLILESSKRVGGRVRTLYDVNAGMPVELGAEFIHGEAKVTRRLVDEARLATVPVNGEHYRSRAGKFEDQGDVWKRMVRVFKRMDADRKEDRSFQEYIDTKPGGPFLKGERALALGFIRGFEAADPCLISEKSLAQQGNPVEGTAQSARVVNGYAALIDYMYAELVDVVRFSSLVQRIVWEDGRVRVFTKDGAKHEARAAIITVPLPHLQDESIAIEPEVPNIRKAARLLVMGNVARVVVVVKERFWEDKAGDLSFVHTPDRPFNAWWTMNPIEAPMIVGWSGGPPSVDIMQGGDIEGSALREMARAFGMRRARAEDLVVSIHAYDWTNDRHSRGAYSYVGVGGVDAPKQLSRPVRGTLFFAGEATDTTSSGTVEGALASGTRAARQVVKHLG